MTPNDVEVDLTPGPLEAEGARFTQMGDGGIEVDLEPAEEAGPMEIGDEENLAEQVDTAELFKIADKLIEMVEADDASRADWKDKFVSGLKACGAIKQDEDYKGPFKGAATVVHPLIIEAVTQFQARAIEEIFPASGPVKAQVLGESNDELEDRRARVEQHMNYQVMREDRGYFWDTDQMLFALGFAGSEFKKSYHDDELGYTRSRYVEAEYVIVSYQATSLEDAPRITHVIPMSHNELLKRQLSGYYLSADKVKLQIPPPEAEDETIKAASDGTTSTDLPEDGQHTLYETALDWDLKGFEHKDDQGKTTGLALPYIITVEKYSRRVLGIRRNYKKSDAKYRKRIWWTHYKLLPGLGFYGWGFIHAIGGLGETATGAIRALLDAAAFSNVPGGFRSKDARVIDKDATLEPGVFLDTELSGEDLEKAFFVPDFGEPSEALFKLLGIVVQAGQRFASTTDEMVGEGNTNVPVGTTVARIEQGMKVYSAIHKRLHQAAMEEFELRSQINYEHLDDNGSDFHLQGSTIRIYREDYGPPIDIVPVSDPNTYSTAQRVAQVQAQLDLADRAPNLYDKFEIHRRMLRALRVQDIEKVLIDPDKIVPADPVTEGMLLIGGKPVKAFPEQDHQAHLAVHQGQMQMLVGTPIEQIVSPAVMAHIADHYAQQYRVEMSMRMGIALPDLPAKEQDRQALPPQTEQEISVRAAMATQAMLQEHAQAQGATHDDEMRGLQLNEQKLKLAKATQDLQNGAQGTDQQAQFADAVNQIREEMAGVVEKIRKDAEDKVRAIQQKLDVAQVRYENRQAEIASQQGLDRDRMTAEVGAKSEMERVRTDASKVLGDFGKELKAMLDVAKSLEAAVKERAKVETDKAQREQGTTTVNIEGMQELVQAVQSTVEMVQQSQQDMAASMERVVAELGKPTQLVTDKAGKPIGAKKVDTLKKERT